MQTEADFTGFITDIHPVGKEDTLGQILVESHADKLVDKYMVAINEETLIFKQDGENRRKVAFAALETQQRVEVWFTGPIMESFPNAGGSPYNSKVLYPKILITDPENSSQD